MNVTINICIQLHQYQHTYTHTYTLILFICIYIEQMLLIYKDMLKSLILRCELNSCYRQRKIGIADSVDPMNFFFAMCCNTEFAKCAADWICALCAAVLILFQFCCFFFLVVLILIAFLPFFLLLFFFFIFRIYKRIFHRRSA